MAPRIHAPSLPRFLPPLGVEMDPMLPLPPPGTGLYMPTFPTPLPIATVGYPMAVPGNAPRQHCGLELSQSLATREQVVSFLWVINHSSEDRGYRSASTSQHVVGQVQLFIAIYGLHIGMAAYVWSRLYDALTH